ncbi:HesA/MoeB/ThiF family protein [Anaeromyxobacter paludicola]|uniref:Thiazole biosynthesis adenylyltransferase ThiF n=1 Tax=Anaeromyxobacter paludicola TaxID=2918171 RepID=A0ABM7XDU8_9BACT|nr:ThiF family adenylyltransferase [Anaeromyxobacter paludicola]BDG10058.1 thiazole biosynthesis adenylyltransferase ThiF [Anaeromyxobacter paludicola]
MRGTLSEKSALVIGAGGPGGAAALVLASAGVGRLTLVDGGAVEPSDLTRQPLFGEAELGERRTAAAARRLGQLFPACRVEPLDRRLDAASAVELTRAVDLVVDGGGDVAAAFLASDAAVAAGRPLVHGGALRYSAQLVTVLPGTTGCLRCLFEEPPPDGPAGSGVLGPLAGLVGALLGAEAVRLLQGRPGTYAGKLVSYESRGGRVRAVPLPRREGCHTCRTGAAPLSAVAGG